MRSKRAVASVSGRFEVWAVGKLSAKHKEQKKNVSSPFGGQLGVRPSKRLFYGAEPRHTDMLRQGTANGRTSASGVSGLAFDAKLNFQRWKLRMCEMC